MYVCVCNAVTERDLAAAIAGGCHTLRQLRHALGVGGYCGRCTSCVRKTLHHALHPHAAHRPHPPAHAADP